MNDRPRATADPDRTRRRFALDEATAILARTPVALKALLSGLPEPWLVATEGSDTWSPIDVIGHLIHCEKTDWLPRTRHILQHGDAIPFEPFDRFAQLREPASKSLSELVDQFEGLRSASLRELAAMKLDE